MKQYSGYLHEDDLKTLKKKHLPNDTILDLLQDLRDYITKNFVGGIGKNSLYAMCKAYSLGVIHGKRIERIRKQDKNTGADRENYSLDEIAKATDIMSYCAVTHSNEEIEEFLRAVTSELATKEKANIKNIVGRAYKVTHGINY